MISWIDLERWFVFRETDYRGQILTGNNPVSNQQIAFSFSIFFIACFFLNKFSIRVIKLIDY